MIAKIRLVGYSVKKIKGTPYIPALNDGALRCFLVKFGPKAQDEKTVFQQPCSFAFYLLPFAFYL